MSRSKLPQQINPAELLTLAESAVVLGLSRPGAEYTLNKAMISRYLWMQRPHFLLRDVERLKARRAQKKERRGRPSALRTLQQRLATTEG